MFFFFSRRTFCLLIQKVLGLNLGPMGIILAKCWNLYFQIAPSLPHIFRYTFYYYLPNRYYVSCSSSLGTINNPCATSLNLTSHCFSMCGVGICGRFETFAAVQIRPSLFSDVRQRLLEVAYGLTGAYYRSRLKTKRSLLIGYGLSRNVGNQLPTRSSKYPRRTATSTWPNLLRDRSGAVWKTRDLTVYYSFDISCRCLWYTDRYNCRISCAETIPTVK